MGDDMANGAGVNRRTLIKAGAAAGAVAWVAPQVISMSSAAAASGGFPVVVFTDSFNYGCVAGVTQLPSAGPAVWTVNAGNNVDIIVFGSCQYDLITPGGVSNGMSAVDLEGLFDRLAMLKYGMDDLRAFFDGDLRWLRHYGFRALDVPTLSGGVGA